MSASTISAMVWPAFASGAGGVSVAGWRFWGGELSLRSSLWRSRGEGDRRRRRWWRGSDVASRSEEQTSELQSPMRMSYAVFCLKKHNIERSEEIQCGSQRIMTLEHDTDEMQSLTSFDSAVHRLISYITSG